MLTFIILLKILVHYMETQDLLQSIVSRDFSHWETHAMPFMNFLKFSLTSFTFQVACFSKSFYLLF